MSLGEKIKFVRESQRYSQKEFGEIIGASQAVVSQYEKNTRKPSFEVLVAIQAFIKKHKLKVKLLED